MPEHGDGQGQMRRASQGPRTGTVGTKKGQPDQARAIVVYHSKRWLVLRQHILNRDPICRMCLRLEFPRFGGHGLIR